MRATIIADDNTVIVNDASVILPTMPTVDVNVHAIQFYSETGHATIEKKAGEREHVTGEAALGLVRPFIDAQAVEMARLKVSEDAVAAKGAAAEKAIKDRQAQLRAELAAEDQKAAERVRAAEEDRRRHIETAPVLPRSSMTSFGTQVI
jgi:hypothetical protein